MAIKKKRPARKKRGGRKKVTKSRPKPAEKDFKIILSRGAMEKLGNLINEGACSEQTPPVRSRYPYMDKLKALGCVRSDTKVQANQTFWYPTEYGKKVYAHNAKRFDDTDPKIRERRQRYFDSLAGEEVKQ